MSDVRRLVAVSCVDSHSMCHHDAHRHAFLNDMPEFVERKKAMGFGDHNAEVAALAWKRSVDFLSSHLQA